jgi:hypothetical protein
MRLADEKHTQLRDKGIDQERVVNQIRVTNDKIFTFTVNVEDIRKFVVVVRLLRNSFAVPYDISVSCKRGEFEAGISILKKLNSEAPRRNLRVKTPIKLREG